MGIKNVQNGAKNLPKWTPNGVPDGPVGGQDGSKIEKNRLKKATQHKTGRHLTAPPLLSRKNGQHGSKLASKIDQKSIKNRCKNRSFFWCLFGVDLWTNFVVFSIQNGAKLVPKWHQKSISTLKAENQLNASRLAFSWLWGVEVRSKNR